MKACVIAALVFLTLAPPLRSQEPPQPQEGEAFTLKSKYLKGDKISVESISENTMEMSFKAGPIDARREQESTTHEAYASQVLDVTEDQLTQKELREYSKARETVKSTQSMGEEEREEPEKTTTLPLEGRTVELTREEDDKTKVVFKGDTKDLPKRYGRDLKIQSVEELLVPATPVKKGDKWTVDNKKLARWLDAAQGQQMKWKAVSGSIECLLKDVSVADGRRIALVEFKIDLEGEAEPAGGGEDEDEDDEDGPPLRQEGEATLKAKGKGELHFNLDEGLPVSFKIQANLAVNFSISFGEEEAVGKGKGTVEMSRTFKLEERKKE